MVPLLGNDIEEVKAGQDKVEKTLNHQETQEQCKNEIIQDTEDVNIADFA